MGLFPTRKKAKKNDHMTSTVYFDHASTTSCCPEALDQLIHLTQNAYGNPSSSHRLGQIAARAISDARLFFGDLFHVPPEQVIFTGSGSESDNLAIYGVAMPYLARRDPWKQPPRVIASAIEHPAVRKTVLSLKELGFDVQLAPVDRKGFIERETFLKLLTPETILVSIMTVNNIVGSRQDIVELAKITKKAAPKAIFHTDAVQAFGKVDLPQAPSPVDLISLSAHKIHGPKGVGALVLLDEAVQKQLSPITWGGDQEQGLRSGTQNAAAISAFHFAAKIAITRQADLLDHAQKLRARLREDLIRKHLLNLEDCSKTRLTWNSSDDAVPYIVSLGCPGIPSQPLAGLLEERGYLVATGSACSSAKTDPDPVLCAMGFPPGVAMSAIRISFSLENQLEEVVGLVQALEESVKILDQIKNRSPSMLG